MINEVQEAEAPKPPRKRRRCGCSFAGLFRMRRGMISNWNPSDSMVIASADPPQPLVAGIGAGVTDADWGNSGFSLPFTPDDDSTWCVAIKADQFEPVGDFDHLHR